MPIKHRAALLAAVAVLLAGCTTGSGSSLPPATRVAEASPPSTGASASPGAVESMAGVVLDGSVVYDKTAGNDVHAIYLLSAGSERQVTKPGAYQLAGISADRLRILVIPSGDLAPPLAGGTIDLDGMNFTNLKLADPTLNFLPATWSPDGSRIAFLGWDDADPARTGIYTARASDLGDLVRVTTRPGPLLDVPLDYAPDGQSIVFYRSAHPDPDPHTGGSLWTVSVNGGEPKEISGASHPADWARWSPDGGRIVFATERLASSGSVWTVSPDGSNLASVFTDPDGGFPITPTWSPNGSEILFALDPTNDEFAHVPNMFALIRSDGTQLRRVVGTTGFNRWPEWWN